MMNGKFKRFIATAMAAISIFGSTMTAFAEGEEATTTEESGTGSVEGWIDTSVVKVKVNTLSENGLNFILDPQNLIKQSIDSGKAKDGYTSTLFPASKSVYFHRDAQSASANDGIESGTGAANANATEVYTDRSNNFWLVNMQPRKVNVGVTAKVVANENINLVGSSSFGTSKGTDLYLALAVGSKTTAVSSNGIAYINAEIDAPKVGDTTATNNDLQVVYVSGNDAHYEYDLKDGKSYKNINIYATGAANTAGNWKDLADTAPSLSITWDLKPQGGATAALTAAGALTVSGLTKDANFKAIAYYDSYGATVADATEMFDYSGTTNWTEADGGTIVGQIKDKSAFAGYGATVYMVITLTDGTTVVTPGVVISGS